MAKDATHPEVNDSLYFAESLRKLWEATRQVVYGGIDTDDLAALCSIVARLAEHRLLRIQSGPSSSESTSAIKQLRDDRDAALKLLAWTKKPTPEPDWSVVSARLESAGASPLEFQR